MRFKELAGKLTGEPAKLWLVTGEEPLLMIEAADMIQYSDSFFRQGTTSP